MPEVRVPLFCPNPSSQPWWVSSLGLNEKSVIYSLGLADDVSFDLGMIKEFDLQVYGFDPTPTSIKALGQQELSKKLKIFPVAVGIKNEKKDFFAEMTEDGEVSYLYSSNVSGSLTKVTMEVRSLSSLMEEFEHSAIDILKVDIEGGEYELLQNIIDLNIPIKQIAVEFHYRFKDFNINLTHDLISRLRSAGYRIAHVGDWCEEFLFVKEESENIS